MAKKIEKKVTTDFIVADKKKESIRVGAFFGLTLVWEIMMYFVIVAVLILIDGKTYTTAQGVVGLCAFFLCMAIIPTYMYAKNRRE
jgi:uncharacterized membrane protein YqjE